jgi:ISXO2 transposase-like protein
MFNRIRNELMAEKEPSKQLAGEVEIDETSWGGRPRRKHKTRSEAMLFRESKPTILGMVERGGRVRLRVIASRRGEPLSREVRAHLNPARSCSPTTGSPIDRCAPNSTTP